MPVESRTIVSLKTECFKRGTNCVFAKVLRTVKRKSYGFDLLQELTNDDIWDIENIEGINTLPDGEYELVIVNPVKDYETSYVDFDGYALKPA